MPESMSRSLTVSYHGVAVEKGLMDVRDLAPALLSIGRLFEASNDVLNGEDAKVAVKVRASFKPGSFEIDLKLVQDFLSQIQSVFGGGESIKTITVIIAALLGREGLVGLLRWLKGRQPENVTQVQDGNVQLTVGGETEQVTVNSNVYNLYLNEEVRNEVGRVAAPLTETDIDSIEFRDPRETEPLETLRKEEADSFLSTQQLTALDETRLEGSYIHIFGIRSLSFLKGNKWRLTDGEKVYNVSIEDEEFLGRVETNEIRFSKDDLVKVQMRSVQTVSPTGKLTTKHVVERSSSTSALRNLRLSQGFLH